ncbi:TPA: type II toxin-antitoxin system RelB family antitoxin, partial [Streptococcus pneumoniae]
LGGCYMNNVVTTQISIQLSQELNSLLNAIVEENNTTKTDFIRQAVIEKIEDMYDIKVADEAYKNGLNVAKKLSHMKK